MTTHTPAGRAFTELILETFRLNGRLLAVGDGLTRPAGQSSARWQVMGALEEGPLTVADVARRMGLARQSVQRTADHLVESGLLETAENPRHRRAKLLVLTARGRSILSRINRRQVSWSNHLADGVPLRALAVAVRVMREMRQRLEAEATKEES